MSPAELLPSERQRAVNDHLFPQRRGNDVRQPRERLEREVGRKFVAKRSEELFTDQRYTAADYDPSGAEQHQHLTNRLSERVDCLIKTPLRQFIPFPRRLENVHCRYRLARDSAQYGGSAFASNRSAERQLGPVRNPPPGRNVLQSVVFKFIERV